MSCARDAACHMKKVSKSVPFRIWTPLMMCVWFSDELTRSTHFQQVCAPQLSLCAGVKSRNGHKACHKVCLYMY